MSSWTRWTCSTKIQTSTKSGECCAPRRLPARRTLLSLPLFLHQSRTRFGGISRSPRPSKGRGSTKHALEFVRSSSIALREPIRKTAGHAKAVRLKTLASSARWRRSFPSCGLSHHRKRSSFATPSSPVVGLRMLYVEGTGEEERWMWQHSMQLSRPQQESKPSRSSSAQGRTHPMCPWFLFVPIVRLEEWTFPQSATLFSSTFPEMA
mmetsp:Transcript_5753/g.17713  ORF Transcript_5753/g.17713 Transcript_5753/m.17713 type:complete len:208 (+) Transcript_5753:1187-1810(+)